MHRPGDRAERVGHHVPAGQVHQRRAVRVDGRDSCPGSTSRRTTGLRDGQGQPSAPSSSSAASATRGTFIRPAVLGEPPQRPARRRGPRHGPGAAGQAYLDADARGLEITKRRCRCRPGPGRAAAAKSDRNLRVRPVRGAVRLRLPRPLPAPDPDWPSTSSAPTANPLAVNATLTQLDSQDGPAADPKAVKYLLDPKGLPPETLRSDWRARQQIALSQPGRGRDNNGLFDLAPRRRPVPAVRGHRRGVHLAAGLTGRRWSTTRAS